MTKKANITKLVTETQTHRTGAPIVRKVRWIVTDAATDRAIDIADTRKVAVDRARFAGYSV